MQRDRLLCNPLPFHPLLPWLLPRSMQPVAVLHSAYKKGGGERRKGREGNRGLERWRKRQKANTRRISVLVKLQVQQMPASVQPGGEMRRRWMWKRWSQLFPSVVSSQNRSPIHSNTLPESFRTIIHTHTHTMLPLSCDGCWSWDCCIFKPLS